MIPPVWCAAGIEQLAARVQLASSPLAPAPLVPPHLASAHLALVPVVPILLLPFILVFFVVFAPLWGAALLALAVLRGIFWPIERVLTALRAPGAGEGSAALARASRWVSTLGGLTERYAASHRGAAAADRPGPGRA